MIALLYHLAYGLALGWLIWRLAPVWMYGRTKNS